MECFVSNSLVDASELGVRTETFGSVPEDALLVRAHLSVDELLAAGAKPYARFIKHTIGRDILEPEHSALLRGTGLTESATDLRTHLALGLRVLRDFAAEPFLEALLRKSRSPAYVLCTLDELRGTQDRIIFTGRALPVQR